MNIFMFTDDSSLEESFLEHKKMLLKKMCKLLQHLVVTQDKSINSLPVNSYYYSHISEKSHVSRLYDSVYSQPILNCNMPFPIFKHPKSEIDKFKPVSEIASFFLIEKLSYFEEKGRMVFTSSQILTSDSYNFLNLQPSLD